MRKIKIKPELLSLLTSSSNKQFNSQSLINAYSELPSSANFNQRQVQQFILRNLYRLESAGLIEKVSGADEKHGNYRLTAMFTTENYSVGAPHSKHIAHEEAKQINPQIDPLLQLKEQLSTHKLELLTTVAETEEYEILCQQLPSKKPEIQELYNDARNRYSQTLGKIKAIESLIARTGNTN